MIEIKGHGSQLGRRKEQAIAALLTSGSVAEAAESVHVSEATLYRWQQQPDFAAQFKHAKSALLEAVTAKLRKHAGKAADTLDALASDVNNQAAARVSASRAILEFHLRAHELDDLVERLNELEKAIEGKK